MKASEKLFRRLTLALQSMVDVVSDASFSARAQSRGENGPGGDSHVLNLQLYNIMESSSLQ